MEADNDLGVLLREARAAAGLTQEELAHRAGISTRGLSDLERGIHRRARRHTLDQLADALALGPNERHRLFATAGASGESAPHAPLPTAVGFVGNGLFVGRNHERAVLEAAWTRACSGTTNVVVIAGEPGIGKSTLAKVSAQDWHAIGATVLLGHCEEDSSDPYRPFLEAFRHVARSMPRAKLAELARSAGPLLGVFIPEIDGPEPTAQGWSGDQLAVLEAARTFLETLTRDRPCVLQLEDMQWADPATLAVLRHVARSGAGRLLVVVSTRVDQDADRPLWSLIVELRRAGALETIELRGLGVGSVGEILRAAAGLAPPELAELLQRETGGNPFFVHGLVGQLVRSDAVRDGRWRQHRGVALNPGDEVRFVVRQRIDEVGRPVRELLQAAAVVGEHFDAPTLAAVAEVPERDVMVAMDTAVASQLADERAFGEWGFVHGIIRSSLYESMTATARARAHERAAVHIESMPDRSAETIDRLALHYHRALPTGGVTAKAAEYAERSAAHAEALLAWEDAAIGFEHALEAVDAQPEPDARRRCDLLLALGRARTHALQRHRARPVFIEAGAMATDAGDALRLRAAANGYAFMTKLGPPGPAAVLAWERALEAVDPADPATRAIVLAALATAMRLSDPSDAEGPAKQSALALGAARTSASVDALLVALATRSAALWDSPDIAARIEIGDEFVAIARAEGDINAELDGLSLLGLPLLAAGRVDEFDTSVKTVERLAGDYHRRIGVAQALQWRAMRALMRGEHEQARQLADEALDISGAAPNFAEGNIAQHHALRRLEMPVRPVDAWLDATAHQERGLTVWRAAVASDHCSAGDLDAARSLLDGFDVRRPGDLSAGWTRLVTLALLAESAAALGDRILAESVESLLLPYSGQLVVVASGTSCEGAVDRYLGLLALTRGAPAEAIGRLGAAATLERSADAPALAARTDADLARVHG